MIWTLEQFVKRVAHRLPSELEPKHIIPETVLSAVYKLKTERNNYRHYWREAEKLALPKELPENEFWQEKVLTCFIGEGGSYAEAAKNYKALIKILTEEREVRDD